MADSIDQYPAPTLRDKARQGTEAAVAAIPYVGGAAVELAEVVMAPSLDKRRDAWFVKLGQLVEELRERIEGFDMAELAEDEVFVSAVADASRIAMGTHLERKLEMLKNCLAVLAASDDRDDFLAMQFLKFVEQLEVEHFLVLEYLRNPGAWFDAKSIPRPNLMSAARHTLLELAELPVEGESRGLALRDLGDRGLANVDMLGGQVRGASLWDSLTTPLGEQLLRFVDGI